MLSDPMLQWVLTLTFSATAAYAALRILHDRKPCLIVGDVLHLLMSLAMIAMCWPWWAAVPALPQLLIFTAGTVWFVALTLLRALRRITRASLGGHGAWHQAAHAVMMLAMVWMILAMEAGTDPAGPTHDHGGLDPWAALTGVAVTASLVTYGVVFVVELILCLRGRTAWLGHTGDVASAALMSLGMAAMCWPMITG